jgi:hypothetical protein
MKYIAAIEAGDKWGISDCRIQLLCKQGRIEGAYRLGWSWAIPEDAEKPVDALLRSERNRSDKNKKFESDETILLPTTNT